MDRWYSQKLLISTPSGKKWMKMILQSYRRLVRTCLTFWRLLETLSMRRELSKFKRKLRKRRISLLKKMPNLNSSMWLREELTTKIFQMQFTRFKSLIFSWQGWDISKVLSSINKLRKYNKSNKSIGKSGLLQIQDNSLMANSQMKLQILSLESCPLFHTMQTMV